MPGSGPLDPGTPRSEVAHFFAGPEGVIRVTSPLSLLAAVPVVLRFHPSPPSIAVIGTVPGSPPARAAFRYDIDGTEDRATARHVAGRLVAHKITSACAVGYGPGGTVTPAADALRGELAAAGITVAEFLRAEGGRYWSYICGNPGCCPPEGTAYDLAGHPATLQYGHLVLPSRRALAATIAPATGPVAAAMREAAQAAARRAGLLAGAAGGQDPKRALHEAGMQAVEDAVSLYRSGGRLTSHGDAAWLLLTLNEIPVRDYAAAYMEPGHRKDHLRMWTDLTRLAQGRDVTAPATLLAIAAWQDGGPLAGIALDRALAENPRYTLALLVRTAVDNGVHPEGKWPPMTPAEVAAEFGYAPPAAGSSRAGKPEAPQAGAARTPRAGRPRPRSQGKRPPRAAR